MEDEMTTATHTFFGNLYDEHGRFLRSATQAEKEQWNFERRINGTRWIWVRLPDGLLARCEVRD